MNLFLPLKVSEQTFPQTNTDEDLHLSPLAVKQMAPRGSYHIISYPSFLLPKILRVKTDLWEKQSVHVPVCPTVNSV